jgi:hypothetical protein
MRTLGWTKPAQVIRVGTKPCRGFTKPIDEQEADESKPEPKETAVNAEPIVEANVNAVVELKRRSKRAPWVRPL